MGAEDDEGLPVNMPCVESAPAKPNLPLNLSLQLLSASPVPQIST